MFIIWVSFVAVFTELYWQFTLYCFLPVFVIDTVWEIINYTNYRKKYNAYILNQSQNGNDSGSSAESEKTK